MPLNNPISNSDLIEPGVTNKYFTPTEKAAILAQILAVNGAPKGVFATAAALAADATANTADGKKNNYLVSADGKWYYWDGSAWAAGTVYQTTGIADSSILAKHLAPNASRAMDFFNSAMRSDGKRCINPIWAIGQINGDGTEGTEAHYFRTPNFITPTDVMYLNIVNSNYKYAYHTYALDGTHLSDSGWKTKFVEIPYDATKKYKIVSTKINNAIVTDANADGENILIAEGDLSLGTMIKDNTITAAKIIPMLSYSIVMSVIGAKPTFATSGNNVIVTMPSGTMYLLNSAGTEIAASPVSAKSQVITVASNQMLVWNVTDNAIVVIGNNDARNAKNIVLLSNYYGMVQNGYFKPWFDDWSMQNYINNYKPLSDNGSDNLVKASIVNYWTQGATLIGDEIWGFNASADDHTTTAVIRRFDSSDLSEKTTKTHNLGHVSTADYSATHNCVLTANGTSSAAIAPRIDIIKNVSDIISNNVASITFGETNILSIPFKTSGKAISGTGLCACFGESDNIIYLLTSDDPTTATSSKKYLYKVLLGTGANDFSDATDANVARWGTFVNGCAAGVLNGTALVLQTYSGGWQGELQGMFYHDNTIYVSTDTIINSKGRASIIGLKCYVDGTFKVSKSVDIPNYNIDGTYQNSFETEDMFVLNNNIMFALYATTNSGVYTIPLSDFN